MDKIPQDRDARRAFLEDWAKLQGDRLAWEETRRHLVEELARVVAQARQRLGQDDSLREVAAIPVVITKPTQLPADRAAVFADLTVRLREYKWADPIVSECDEPRYIAPSAIELARRHRPDAPWLLYMEDDVIPGPDFGWLPEILSEADELFPHTGVVNFFSVWVDEPGWSIHPMQEFFSTLCFAIRNTDHLVGFRAFVDSAVTQSAGGRSTMSRTRHELPNSQRTRPTRWEEIDKSDFALRMFLAVEYDSYPLWCPSLVQHADVTSVFIDQSQNWPLRISPSYKLAYG